MRYILYNNDTPIAKFTYEKGTVSSYEPKLLNLLPMQIQNATAEGFTLWLQERAIDLNVLLHRRLAADFIGSRDKVSIAIATHMYSISDTFTCFAEGEFTPREQLCRLEDQNLVCDFILVSSDTSLRMNRVITPNASTDGSFPKTWRYENGAWWLYKLQSSEASRSEYAISKALHEAGWSAAVYAFDGSYRKRIKTQNFVGKNEFFEPYDSLRFMFEDRSDHEPTVYANMESLGGTYARDFRRILLADSLFMNTDRHMRNFGVIRSSVSGEILRLAPNFDNNQAFRSNPGMLYSDAMLKDFSRLYGWTGWDDEQLSGLIIACRAQPYLADCVAVGERFMERHSNK